MLPQVCHRSLLTLSFFFAIAGCADDGRVLQIPPSDVTVIPKPKVYDASSSQTFSLRSGDILYADSLFLDEANYLVEALSPFLNELTVQSASRASAVLRILHDPTIAHPEGYGLRIGETGIELLAGSDKGAFYAIQTLLQLQYEALHTPTSMAFLLNTVVDEPKFEHRGMLLDCCRHFMEPDFIKRYLDLLARYKMNVFHWHLTEDQGWRFESHAYPLLTEVGAWRKHPEGGSYGGFYSHDEMRAIVDYATARHIKVIPEIELPGHSSAAIASYPWLSCTGDTIPVETEWGVFKDIYCAGNDSTLRFLETVFDEVLDIFPSNIIHIGGDEAPKTRWEKCPRCQKRIAAEGLHDEHDLQGWFVNHFRNYLNEHGRILMGWDEILEGGDALVSHASGQETLGLIVQSWRGMEGGKTAAEHGIGAVMSPTSHAYFDYGVKSTDLEKVYSFDPIPHDLNLEQVPFILGGECNMWTEHAPQYSVDSKVFPRILAMSEVLWTYPANRNFEHFSARIKKEYPRLDSLGVEYGPAGLAFDIKVLDEVVPGFEVQMKSSPDSSFYRWNSGRWMELPANSKLIVPDSIEGRGRLQLIACETKLTDTTTIEFARHSLLRCTPHLTDDYSPYYTGGGIHALTDGVIGSYDFRDGHWQGFSGVDLNATFSFESPTAVNRVSIPFYTYSNAWIFLPEEIHVYGSVDGVNWTSLGIAKNPLPEDDKRQAVVELTIELDAPEPMQMMRVFAKNRCKNPPWHDAPGEPAWLFASEIIAISEVQAK